jgi:hypothetical protein
MTNVAIQETLSELMVDKKTSDNSLYVMCLLNKITMIVVNRDKRLYRKYTGTQNPEETYLCYKTPEGFYSIDLDTTQLKIVDIEKTCIEVGFGGAKPLKSASAYKVDELVALCQKLGIVFDENERRPKKGDIYAKVSERFLQF